MKNIILSAIFILSASAFASEPNFECELFGKKVDSGKLTLTGTDSMTQEFKLSLKESASSEERVLSGQVYLADGMVKFTDLLPETQEGLKNALIYWPQLTTGDLILFTNTKDISDSTLNIYLMPSGEIAYLQIGFVEAFCK